VIFAKLIYSTVEKDLKEDNSQDITTFETLLTSKSMECDVEMHSLEDTDRKSLQSLEKGYFCK